MNSVLASRARYVEWLLDGYVPYQRHANQGRNGRVVACREYSVSRWDLMGMVTSGLILWVTCARVRMTIFVRDRSAREALMVTLQDLRDRRGRPLAILTKRGSFAYSVELRCDLESLPLLIGTLFAECLV